MNIAEQIKSFEAKRAALAASLSDIMSKAADEGRTLDAEETESYDDTSTEIKAVDEHLKRLRDMESNMASTAKPVSKAANGDVTTVKTGATAIIRVEQKLEKGIAFARFAKALAAANGSRSEALEIARKTVSRRCEASPCTEGRCRCRYHYRSDTGWCAGGISGICTGFC